MIAENGIDDTVKLLRSCGYESEAALLDAMRQERNDAAAAATDWRGIALMDVAILEAAAAVLTAVANWQRKRAQEFEL